MDEFIFSYTPSGEKYKTKAENSDKALQLCLKETSWDMNLIVYQGRSVAVESPQPVPNRDELRFIP